jgi:hypothetical protein
MLIFKGQNRTRGIYSPLLKFIHFHFSSSVHVYEFKKHMIQVDIFNTDCPAKLKIVKQASSTYPNTQVNMNIANYRN